MLFVLCLAYLRAQCNLKEVHPLPAVFLGTRNVCAAFFGAALRKSGECALKGEGEAGAGCRKLCWTLKVADPA